ncbi:MAG: polysaccharide deacetylase [Lachnospiraceae bacterium]|nr:polysaccharide deacetylase [Lachnospiraceae bacterium]
MRNWMGVIKGMITVGLVITVLGLLFTDRGIVTDAPGGTTDSASAEEPGKGQLEDSSGDVLPTVLAGVEQDTSQGAGTGGSADPDIAGEDEETSLSYINNKDALSERELIERGKVIYLTFDDGPGKYTAELLDILAKYDIKATFFVTGGNEGYFDMIGRAKDEGHTIGIHCYNHDYKKVYASEHAYFADLEKIDEIIFDQTGERAQLVRFPGGSSNISSKFNPGIMTRLTGMVEEKGYRYFDWNVLSGDAGDTKDTEEIIRNMIDGILKKDISVVLQHDLYDYSIAAVEEVILWGLENGYAFLPLSMESPTIHHPIAN